MAGVTPAKPQHRGAPGVSDPSQQIVSVPVDALIEHPNNPRIGDPEGIADSLRAHGQYKPLVVQESTGRVLAGNHTLKAARSLGWTEVNVVHVDCDDEQALKILLIDNKSGDDSTYDNAILLEVLQELPDLDGTGYDSTDLELLAFDVNDQAPVEMPRAVDANGGEAPTADQVVWGYIQFGTRRVTLTAVEVERLNALHDLFVEAESTDVGWGHAIADGLDTRLEVDSEQLAVERLNDASRILRAGKRGRAQVDGSTQFSGLADLDAADEDDLPGELVEDDFDDEDAA
jgi:ParB-like chromosome segregation protein Spo0J